MKKNFLMLIVLLLSCSVFAESEPFGGVIINQTNFDKLHLTCLETSQDPKILCQRARAILTTKEEIIESQDLTLYRYEVKSRANSAAKKRKNILKESYLGIGFAGTGLSLFGAAFSGADAGEFLHMMAIGALIDLAKAPVVISAYFVHKFLAKRKVRKAIHTLLSPSSKNSYYSLKTNSFQAIKLEFFPEYKQTEQAK